MTEQQWCDYSLRQIETGAPFAEEFMTEAEWLACRDYRPMLVFLGIQFGKLQRLSERKERLFAVACCRYIWGLITDERSRLAVELAERAADGEVPVQELRAAKEAAFKGVQDRSNRQVANERGINPGAAAKANYAGAYTAVPAASGAAAIQTSLNASHAAAMAELVESPEPVLSVEGPRLEAEQKALADILRDIAGNPFRPIAIVLDWLTPDVLALARAIYEERSFDRLPALAFSLEKAGCNQAEILSHCRSSGAHFRGCWVIDLLLGILGGEKNRPYTMGDRVEKSFYPNAQRRAEVPYVNAVVNGIAKIWHPNGVLAQEIGVQDGKYEGVGKEWNDRGELLGTYEVRNGCGVIKHWYPDGPLLSETQLVKGNQRGRIRVWSPSGKVGTEEFFIENQKVTKKKYLEASKKNPELPKYED